MKYFIFIYNETSIKLNELLIISLFVENMKSSQVFLLFLCKYQQFIQIAKVYLNINMAKLHMKKCLEKKPKKQLSD